MTTLLMVVIAIVFQIGLNVISTKRGYGIGKKAQIAAVVSSVVLLVAYNLKFGFSIDILLISLASCILVSTFFVDFKHYIIPNGYNLSLFGLGALFVLNNLPHWVELLKGGAFFFVAFLLLLILTGGQLGGGDVKMSVSLGLFLGASSFLNYMMITFLSGALISVILLLLKLKKKEDKIAFGPYMIVAFICMLPW